MKNSSVYKMHRQALKDLAAAFAKAKTDAEAKWLRRTIRRVREELYELVVRDLEQSSSTYQPITNRFKNGTSDLKRVRQRADEFQIAADKISRLIAWATKFLPLL